MIVVLGLGCFAGLSELKQFVAEQLAVPIIGAFAQWGEQLAPQLAAAIQQQQHQLDIHDHDDGDDVRDPVVDVILYDRSSFRVLPLIFAATLDTVRDGMKLYEVARTAWFNHPTVIQKRQQLFEVNTKRVRSSEEKPFSACCRLELYYSFPWMDAFCVIVQMMENNVQRPSTKQEMAAWTDKSTSSFFVSSLLLEAKLLLWFSSLQIMIVTKKVETKVNGIMSKLCEEWYMTIDFQKSTGSQIYHGEMYVVVGEPFAPLPPVPSSSSSTVPTVPKDPKMIEILKRRVAKVSHPFQISFAFVCRNLNVRCGWYSGRNELI
jgi:hypothetical protein